MAQLKHIGEQRAVVLNDAEEQGISRIDAQRIQNEHDDLIQKKDDKEKAQVSGVCVYVGCVSVCTKMSGVCV